MDKITSVFARFLAPSNPLTTASSILGRSILIAWGILLYWFVAIAVAGDTVYKWHSKFYKISREDFEKVNYLCMGIFKIMITVVYICPYLAIRMVAKR